MKIYLTHAKSIKYQKLIYQPIMSSSLWTEHDWTLPYLKSNKAKNSKKIIENSDLVIAEISQAATGQGIELGWADMVQTRILCLYRQESQPSRSLQEITSNFIEYKNSQEMIVKISKFLAKSQ